MWVNREQYIRLREQVSAQSSTIEWLRQRVNQLEREKGALLQRQTGEPVMIPEIARAEPTITATPNRATRDEDRPSMEDLVRGNLSFEDMGDAAARSAGVDWDDSGQVIYR